MIQKIKMQKLANFILSRLISIVSIRIGEVEFKCLVDEYEEGTGFLYSFDTGDIKLDEFLNENFDDDVQKQLNEYRQKEIEDLEQWKLGI